MASPIPVTGSTTRLSLDGDTIVAPGGLIQSGSLKVESGACGTAVLVAGTKTVTTTKARTTSLIFLTVKTPGGTQGYLSVGTVTDGTSFVINSTSGSETSTVAWMIVEPKS